MCTCAFQLVIFLFYFEILCIVSRLRSVSSDVNGEKKESIRENVTFITSIANCDIEEAKLSVFSALKFLSNSVIDSCVHTRIRLNVIQIAFKPKNELDHDSFSVSRSSFSESETLS